MAEYAGTRTADGYDRFLSQFRASIVGVVAVGKPSQDASGRFVADGKLGAGKTTHGDGLARILAFADPQVALRNFGSRFNAGLPGEVLLHMAATDPHCHGILVNSALREISLVISKATAQSLLSSPAAS
jgi:hypothetical protein